MDNLDKAILLQDLSARLPYGVKGIITYNGGEDIFTLEGIFNILFLSDTESCKIEDFKPYLRTMSSMTEDERSEFYKVGGIMSHKVETDTYVLIAFGSEAYDWLNSHHFDYRCLIEKGLAHEAPKDMYNVK
jgi:hypothetical protein